MKAKRRKKFFGRDAVAVQAAPRGPVAGVEAGGETEGQADDDGCFHAASVASQRGKSNGELGRSGTPETVAKLDDFFLSP